MRVVSLFQRTANQEDTDDHRPCQANGRICAGARRRCRQTSKGWQFLTTESSAKYEIVDRLDHQSRPANTETGGNSRKPVAPALGILLAPDLSVPRHHRCAT